MQPEKQFWEKCYAEKNTGWDRGGVHPAIARWLGSGMLEPCRIVLPGCGRGYEAKHLAENGFDVTAIDYAEDPLQFLKDQVVDLPNPPVLLQQDIFDFDPETKFDAVYEQTCLCAIAPECRADYEERVFSWLKPGGTLFVLLMQCDQLQRSEGSPGGPPFHCAVGDMRKLFASDRWEWMEEPVERFDHPSGVIFELAGRLRKIVN